MRLPALFAALVLGAVVSPGPASAAGGCASGYHLDGQGACQPDAGETNRYCPAGSIYHAAPYGFYCETPQSSAASTRTQAPARRNAPRVVERPARDAEAYEPAPRRTQRAPSESRPARRVVARSAPTAPTPAVEPAPVAPILSGGGAGGGAGGGGGGGWSDRRLKHDIVRLGTSPSGLPVYAFQYVWGGPRYVGVMAQDLLKLRPDAVARDESGYYKVDYSRIDVKMRVEASAAY